MALNIAEGERFDLPTFDALEEERARPPSIPALKKRIDDIIGQSGHTLWRRVCRAWRVLGARAR